jgi:hypothetical protein
MMAACYASAQEDFMSRKITITLVLLFTTLFSTTSYGAGYQKYFIYYSDSTFTTPVGKRFMASTEECDPPYDNTTSRER